MCQVLETTIILLPFPPPVSQAGAPDQHVWGLRYWTNWLSLSPSLLSSPPPYSNRTTDSERLYKTQQITPILSINASASPGLVAMFSMGIALLCRIRYFLLTKPMTLSTWIRKIAIFLVSAISYTAVFSLWWMQVSVVKHSKIPHCHQY